MNKNSMSVGFILSQTILFLLLIFAVIVSDWIHVVFIAPLIISLFIFYPKNILPKGFLFLFPIIALLTSLGSIHVFRFYLTLPWYDDVMHFLAAFVVAYFLGFLFEFSPLREVKKSPLLFIATVVSFVLAIGALWEVTEWIFNSLLLFDLGGDVDDYAIDLITDGIGAFFGAVTLIYFGQKRKQG